MIKNKQAFTLVELIVVITILAILGTIAFISLQGYSKTARDSRRISDIGNIKTTLELFTLNTGYYPLPDVNLDGSVSYSGDLLWTQGTFGDTVTTNLSTNLPIKPTDPLYDKEYTYSVTNNGKEYQVLNIFEGELGLNNNLINNSYAENNYSIKVEGTYNNVFVKTNQYLVPVPSIITSETLPLDLMVKPEAIDSMVITGGSNFPDLKIPNIGVQTGQLDINLSVYTGSLTNNTSNQEKINAINKIKLAYVWTEFENQDIYANILNSKDPISLADQFILNNYENPLSWCNYLNTPFVNSLGWTDTELKYDNTTKKCYVFGDEDTNTINACNSWVSNNITIGGKWVWVPARNFVTDGNGTNLKDSFYQREVSYNGNTYVCRGFAVMKYEAKFEGDQSGLTVVDLARNTKTCSDYTTDDDVFCATINGATKITSTKENYPIGYIKQGEAIDACRGTTLTGSHLITNNEWMTIARNIESQAVNLRNSDKLYRGVNGGKRQGGEDGTLGCGKVLGTTTDWAVPAGIDNTKLTSLRTSCDDMRQNKLSNNSLVWDIAGNVWENVNKSNIPYTSNSRFTNDGWNGNILNGSLGGNTAPSWIEWSDTGINSTNLSNYGPISIKDNTNGVGKLVDTIADNRTFIRSASGNLGNRSGIYTINISLDAASQYFNIGFRCAW